MKLSGCHDHRLGQKVIFDNDGWESSRRVNRATAVLKIPDTASLLAETDVDRRTLKPQTRLRLTWAYLANARLLFSVHLERFARSIITLPGGSLRADHLIARCLVAVHDAWPRD